MKRLLILLNSLVFINYCGKSDDNKDDDSNTMGVPGNCVSVTSGFTTCMEIVDQKDASLFEDSCTTSLSGTWTAGKACDVPAGTKGCATEGTTNDDGSFSFSTKVYYVGFEGPCEGENQTEITKE